MAAQVGALRVTVGADITGLKTGMARAQREVRSGATAMQKSVAGVASSFKGLGAAIGVSLGAATFAIAARGFLRVADASKQLTAQLKLATAEFGSFERAQKDVRRIAETTRTGLAETANLYAVFQRNAKELGITQEQSARATETVNKTFQISGASAAEAAGGLRQFLQALQSGQLRGEEFNSVMENAPRLARLLADSLGVTIGQLRAMAKEGEITGDKLVRALTDRKFTEQIDAEFRQLPVTFDQAMTQIYNAAVVTFGAFDEGGQFSSMIANFANGGAQDLASLEARARQFGVETRAVMDGLSAAFDHSRDTGVAAFFDIEGAVFSLRDAISGLLGVVDGLKNAFVNLFQAPANIGRLLLGQSPVLGTSDMRGAFNRGVDKSRLDATRRGIFGRSLNDVLAENGMGRTPPPFRAVSSKGKKGGGAKAPRDRSADVEFQFDQEILQAKRAILDAQRTLSRDAAERARISLQILDLEKEEQAAELDNRVRRAEKDAAEGRITKDALAKIKADAEILRAKYDEVHDLKVQEILRAEDARVREEQARLEDTKLDVKIAQLEAEDALATTAAEHRDIQLRILDHQHELERLALERILADADSTEAAKEEARVRLSALAARQQAERSGVMQSTMGPWESFVKSLPDTAAEAQEAFESLKVQGIMGAVDALVDLRHGFESFRDTALRVLDEVIAQLIRLQIMKMIAGFMGGPSGGLTGEAAFNATAGLPGFAHGGGFQILGRHGIDNNTLALNGLPIAKVSYGEQVSVSNDNGPSMMGGAPVTINVNAPMSDRDARRTGSQLYAGWASEQARARAKGIA